MARDKGKRRARDEEEEDEEVLTDYEDESAARSKSNKSKKKNSSSQKKKQNDKSKGSSDSDRSSGDEETSGKKKGKTQTLTDEEKKRLAYELVRHALLCELTKRPIRREDVVKTFLSTRPRAFDAIVPVVSAILQRDYGLELVQLRAKDSAASKNPPKSYVVRSRLPTAILRAASLTQFQALRDPLDEEPPKTELWGQAAAYKHDGEHPGTLRDWRHEEGSSYGILGVILALILVNGKAIQDDQLISQMKKLSIFPDSRIPHSIAFFAVQGAPNFRQYLATLVKYNYLERAPITGASAATAQQTQQQQTQGKSRGRQSMSAAASQHARVAGTKDDTGDPTIEWKWGSRAEIEIGEVGIAKFIETVYFAGGAGAQDEEVDEAGSDEDEQDEEDNEDEEGSSQRKKKASNKKAKARTNGQPSRNELRRAIARAADTRQLENAMEIKAVN